MNRRAFNQLSETEKQAYWQAKEERTKASSIRYADRAVTRAEVNAELDRSYHLDTYGVGKGSSGAKVVSSSRLFIDRVTPVRKPKYSGC